MGTNYWHRFWHSERSGVYCAFFSLSINARSQTLRQNHTVLHRAALSGPERVLDSAWGKGVYLASCIITHWDHWFQIEWDHLVPDSKDWEHLDTDFHFYSHVLRNAIRLHVPQPSLHIPKKKGPPNSFKVYLPCLPRQRYIVFRFIIEYSSLRDFYRPPR